MNETYWNYVGKYRAEGYSAQITDEPKQESWYCEPCAVEVYSLRCSHCGKTKRERR